MTYASESYVIRGNVKRIEIPVAEKPGPVYNSENIPNEKEVNVKLNAPKQISTIVVYNDTKKRVVLKNNQKKGIYEYKLDILKQKLAKKFSGKGLQGDFGLQTASGQVIQNDMDIVNHLADYKGEIQVTQ